MPAGLRELIADSDPSRFRESQAKLPISISV
jgi:hypothetical protein